jgi:hypothetical protein
MVGLALLSEDSDLAMMEFMDLSADSDLAPFWIQRIWPRILSSVGTRYSRYDPTDFCREASTHMMERREVTDTLESTTERRVATDTISTMERREALGTISTTERRKVTDTLESTA